MDGCSRQDPAYRPAKGRAPRGAFPIGNRRNCRPAAPRMGFVGPGLGEKQNSGGMASTTSKKRGAAADAYCPHCHLLIDKKVGEGWPDEPLRCPHCRLLVGVGRARPTPAAEPGARGSAAGVFAHEAKRAGGDADSASKEEVCSAIREVAEEVGSRPE